VGRLKRSSKTKLVEAVKPAPAEAEVEAVAERIVGAFCPVCGKTVIDRAVKIGYVSVGHTPYFESIEWDPDKPFGISFAAAGRGSLQDRKYVTPEDCPELFEAVKARFLQALAEWVNKNWISPSDIESIISH